MVAAYIPPDNTNQVGNPYKSNLDGAIVAGARIAVAFLPQAQDTPNMTVKVLAGALMIGGVLTEIAQQNTGTITAPVGNPRIDRVVLNPADGTIAVVTGTPAGSPVAPAIPADRLPICRFQLAPSTTAIANSMIVDERVGSGGSSSNSAAATITAGEALAIRDLIYQDVFNQRSGGADRWYKVDTDAVGPVFIGPRIGIALAAISSGASGTAQLRPGRVAGFSGLTAGQAVFASATAGGVTQTAPAIPATGTQNATRRIGYAASATEIDFDPEDDTIFTARNSAVAVDGTITVQHWTDTGAREREQAAYLVGAASQVLVSQGAGTAIGNMTANGGLAAAFDGNTSQNRAASAQGNNVAYVGKNWGSGQTKTISGAAVWGSTDIGYYATSGGSITVTLYGSNSAPANATDGTSLGTFNVTDSAGNTVTQLSGFTTTTAYRYHWLAMNPGGGTSHFAEVRFYEDAAARDEPLTIGSTIVNASATDRVNFRFDDGSGGNADTRTTAVNRTGATRDLVVEVVL